MFYRRGKGRGGGVVKQKSQNNQDAANDGNEADDCIWQKAQLSNHPRNCNPQIQSSFISTAGLPAFSGPLRAAGPKRFLLTPPQY